MNKDWTGTSASAFKMMGASNHCQDEREQNDYYATDPIAINKLLEKENFDKNKPIWECACGELHLSKRLNDLGYTVKNSDIVNRVKGGESIEIIDFLKDDFPEFDGSIITNPPYKYCTEFILKSLDTIKTGNKVAMFLKLQTLEGQDRYKKVFQKYPPKAVYVFVKRITCAKNGNFNLPSSSAVCYAWFVWEKGNYNQTIIDWIV